MRSVARYSSLAELIKWDYDKIDGFAEWFFSIPFALLTQSIEYSFQYLCPNRIINYSTMNLIEKIESESHDNEEHHTASNSVAYFYE